MPKELLPMVDKPLSQFVAEEAIKVGINTLIFITWRNKGAIEDHFDNNQELEIALSANDKAEQAAKGVKCIFVRQSTLLGLGHAVLCAGRAVRDGPFAVSLADDFLTYEDNVVKADLARGLAASGKTQLSAIELNGPDICKHGVEVPNNALGSVAVIV